MWGVSSDTESDEDWGQVRGMRRAVWILWSSSVLSPDVPLKEMAIESLASVSTGRG